MTLFTVYVIHLRTKECIDDKYFGTKAEADAFVRQSNRRGYGTSLYRN